MTNNNVTSICFNSDSSILTAGTFKGEIMNFNIPTMSKSNAKIQLNSKINLIRYSPFYSTYVASSLMDGTIKIIDTTTGNIVTNFAGYHQGAATGICFSPINKLFLSSVGVDNRVNFYDVLAKKHIKTINTTSPLTSIAFNTDGQTIAVGNINGGISIYDLRNSSSPKFIISDHNTEINHLEFSLKNKIRDLNSSGLNSSRVDLNSSRMNKSFNSGEINAPSSMVNQSVAENNKLIAENKINIDNNKLKISDTSKANESEFKTVKENLKKQIEINQKFIDKKKILDGPQVLNESNMILNEKNLIKPNFPLSQNLNTERTIIDIEKDKKQTKITNSITNNTKNANINTNDDLEIKTQNFIQTCIETEMDKMKQFIHEEINSLHVDLIRQFEIQHAELIKSMKNFSLVNNKMAKEIEKLKKENTNLKSQFF